MINLWKLSSFSTLSFAIPSTFTQSLTPPVPCALTLLLPYIWCHLSFSTSYSLLLVLPHYSAVTSVSCLPFFHLSISPSPKTATFFPSSILKCQYCTFPFHLIQLRACYERHTHWISGENICVCVICVYMSVCWDDGKQEEERMALSVLSLPHHVAH